ncbi:MAG: hypothetical protein NWR98_07275, partial [Litorivicinaceae bacterium]|nr:hypothetical protein [Litorivicinaceae bacterium]
ELEREWHAGPLDRLLWLGMQLADQIPAYMAVVSKAERGERLIRAESPVFDPFPTTRLGWINRLSRMLDPLSGPSPQEAIRALDAIGDPVTRRWRPAVERGEIPTGLGRWMIESQQGLS